MYNCGPHKIVSLPPESGEFMCIIVAYFFISAEKQKNEHALRLVNKILDEATWINIHWLPVSYLNIYCHILILNIKR